MTHPLYECVPRWITNIVETKKCYKCGTKVDKKHICAMGIRSLADNKNTIYVEHSCPKCSSRTITSFAREKISTVEELCYMLIEQIHGKRRLEKSGHLETRRVEGQIQEQEVKLLVDFMNRAESYEDLLKYIGSEIIPESKKPKDKPDEG